MFSYIIIIIHIIYIFISGGLIGEDYLLEIKCPYSARDSNDVIESVNSKLVCVITRAHNFQQ